jgi:hypothetical protein
MGTERVALRGVPRQAGDPRAIPDSQSGGNTDLATSATMAGFAIIMVLDVALR